MNIFEIQEDLQALIDTLEANGGEVDDELLNQFTATNNDFKDKCLSYAEVIQTLNNDLVLIKEEKDRLDRIKKQKEKSIKFLNDTLVAAIERFGTPDKKGKRIIDYGTKKLSVKETKSVEVKFIYEPLPAIHIFGVTPKSAILIRLQKPNIARIPKNKYTFIPEFLFFLLPLTERLPSLLLTSLFTISFTTLNLFLITKSPDINHTINKNESTYD